MRNQTIRLQGDVMQATLHRSHRGHTVKIWYTAMICMLVVISLAAVPPVIVVAKPSVATNLTLTQAVDLAVRDNASLKSLRARREAMAERPIQARALSNPMFTYGGMDKADGGEWLNTHEKRLMVDQEFPWFGKRGLREGIAKQDAEAMQHDVDAMTREVVMRVKESYFDLYAVQRAFSLTRDEEVVLKRLETVAGTMYATGERSQQDVLKAQAETTLLKQKLLELQVQEATLQAKLNMLLNCRADTTLGLVVATPPTSAASNADSPDELDVDVQSLFAVAEKARPEIHGAEAVIRRSQYERELMKKEFWPDYRLGLEYRDFAPGDNMVMFTVGFDLPIWLSKYRAGVREAEKMIEAGHAALEAVQQQVAFEVQDAQFKLSTARRTLDLYKIELIPQAEARFNASEAGYRTGKVDFMDLLESERFLLSARIMAAMAEGNLGIQSARLERALGTETSAPDEMQQTK